MKEFILKLKNLFKPINKNSDGYHTFDELYEHRIALFIAYINDLERFNIDKVWKSKVNSDGSKWKGWFVAGIEDKITYHIPMKYWKKVNAQEIEKGLWDGHTSKDVIKRLLEI